MHSLQTIHIWYGWGIGEEGGRTAYGDPGSALVQNGKLGGVVEQPGHAQALLLPQTQLGAPVHHRPRPTLPVHQVLQVDLRKQLPEA